MAEYAAVLKTVSIFAALGDAERASILRCLGTETKAVPKNGVILRAGEKPAHVGIVLSGTLHIVKDDLDGNRTLIAVVAPGELFAQALCCAGVRESPVTVLAGEDAQIMLLRFDRILHTCPSACPYHQKLIENMLKLVAQKNLYLQNRMDILTVKSIRVKVMRYLGALAAGRGREITVPFNREGLAAYLGAERSALSHELMKMKRDGLIDYRKNKFILR